MYESLKINGSYTAYCPHLLNRSLAGKYHTLETHLFHELYTLYGGVVALSTCMQLYRGQIALHKPHILYYESIYTRIIETVYHLHGRLNLIIEQQRIHRSKHLGTIQMSITHKMVDILNGIGSSSSCTKSRCTNIECVCTMIYCLAPKL